MKATRFALLGTSMLLASGAVHGDAGTTREGHPACARAHWLEAAVAAISAGEDALFERYIDTGRCFRTRADMDIEVLNHYGDGGDERVEFLFRGMQFFTVREAIATSM